MASIKSIANMQIGGSRYPKKRRINLYQNQIKKEIIAAELGIFAVFMVLVYAFSQVAVVGLLNKADTAEAIYSATERQLDKLKESNKEYDLVVAEYAHYGNGYLNAEEAELPDRERMLDSLKANIFTLTAVSSVSITADQMSVEGTLPNGSLFPDLIRDMQADENVRYATASLEETLQKDGQENALASSKNVGVSMMVFFNKPGEGGQE